MIEKAKNKTDIQAEMGPLAGQVGGHCEAIEAYFAHYGLDWPGVEHRFGWFTSGRLKLAGHIWKQKSPAAMVIVMHGYMNHTGQMRHLIAALLEQGFSVAAFDLPGHGLSEGKTASVQTFEDYTAALLEFTSVIQQIETRRPHFVGFSTGCGVAIDALADGRSDVFDRVVLVSPLIRWRGWAASKWTYRFYRLFTDKVRWIPQNNSSDPEFLDFIRHKDFLQSGYVCLDWVRTLMAWNTKIERMAPCPRPILILQGDRDTTVDWRYNIRLLRDKFPAGQVEMIAGARHELFNEATPLWQEAIGKTTAYLG